MDPCLVTGSLSNSQFATLWLRQLDHNILFITLQSAITNINIISIMKLNAGWNENKSNPISKVTQYWASIH